jgi:hypothetical protein
MFLKKLEQKYIAYFSFSTNYSHNLLYFGSIVIQADVAQEKQSGTVLCNV